MKKELYIQTRITDEFKKGYGIVDSKGKVNKDPENDFFLDIFLTKDNTILNYVQEDRDREIFTMERQQFDPLFVELEMTENVNRIKINNSGDLTPIMIDYIRFRRPDIIGFSGWTDQRIKEWFDDKGIKELPWNEGGQLETTIYDIEKSDLTSINASKSVISRAEAYSININR